MDEKVMVAGHLCLDISPSFPNLQECDISEVFSSGRLTMVDKAVLSTGGAVSNTGLAMAKLGVDVALNGKIGADAFGDIIRRLIGEEHAGALKVVADQSSSYTIVLAPPGIDRFVLHNPATNDTFGPEDIDYDLAGQCALFHFGYPPLMKCMYQNDGRELARIYNRIKNMGVTTALDMAMPDPSARSGQVNWTAILERVLPYVDIFLPSIEEVAFMLNRELFDKRKARAQGGDPVLAYEAADCTAISSRLLDMGTGAIAIKCGITGLYLRTAPKERIESMGAACPEDVSGWSDRELWASTFKADNFRSALGAGDATIAGFLCALIRGYSPEDSLNIANTVGWQNVQAIDALSGIGNWHSVLEMLADKDRQRNTIRLDSEGWRFRQTEQIYCGPQDRG